MKKGILFTASFDFHPRDEEAIALLVESIFERSPVLFNDFLKGTTTATLYLENRKEWSLDRVVALREGISAIMQDKRDRQPKRTQMAKIRFHLGRLKHENWAETWKSHFKELRFGSGLRIRPSWSKKKAKPGEIGLVIDPGLSFGTGHHPTTGYCLKELIRVRVRGKPQRFLDAGTGSGILAVAAAKLGYWPVLALDLDPVAVRTARQNAALNQVLPAVRIKQQDVLKFHSRSSFYDVICANLTAEVLIQAASRLSEQLKTPGNLIVAGILNSEFIRVRRALERRGLKLVSQRVEQGWQSANFFKNDLA